MVEIEVGQDVSVADDERPVVEPGLLGGKANSTSSIERLGLDGEADLDAGPRPIGECRRKGV